VAAGRCLCEGSSEHDGMASVGIPPARHVAPAGTHEEVDDVRL
jgi:hypothetical protein